MVLQRNSSLDLGYTVGDLSLFPLAQDDRDQLYEVKNNAETSLRQSLTYNGKYIVVNDNSAFPNRGLLRLSPPPTKQKLSNYELIYYDQKTDGIFRNLIRGFAGSRQGEWPTGSLLKNAVMAEHHNAVRDALINMERDLGTEELPAAETLNFILKEQENRFLSPKPLFRAFPIRGAPPLRVRFQNFSAGPLIRFLWDFGDGTTSVEKSPIHTYQNEGIYTVKLNIITSLGAQGVVTKTNYITVDEEEKPAFFYVTPREGYSRETAASLDIEPTTFTFVDQTDGDITQRYWIFDGAGFSDDLPIESQSIAQFDPNIHTIDYTYEKPGQYQPSLLVIFSDQKLKRTFLKDLVTVS